MSGSIWMHSVANYESRPINGTYYNLIPSRFPTVNLFERLDAARQDEIAEIESMTNPRAMDKARILGGQEVVDTNIPTLQNFNHAPFTYYNPNGSRFYGPNHAALELSSELPVAILRSIVKREVFLKQTQQKSMALEMRELSRQVSGQFVDLTGLDPSTTKDARLKIGKEIDELGFDGLIFSPEERPSSSCISIRKNHVLGTVKQGDHFKFFWDGEKIMRVYSFGKSEIIELAELARLQTIQAA